MPGFEHGLHRAPKISRQVRYPLIHHVYQMIWRRGFEGVDA